jgi:K(+)-stimulated pyrophosphate-energized sodium pump
MEAKTCHTDAKMIGKCDLSECAKMTKEACAKMCDEKGCSPEEKAACLAHYDASGKFVASTTDKACCKKEDKKECCKEH